MGIDAATWRRRILLAIVIVAVVLLMYYFARHVLLGSDHFTIEQTRPVASSVDGMKYHVHEGHPEYNQAADRLANLNSQIVDLMRYLRNKYVGTPMGAKYPARLAAVERMLQRYNPDNLAENSPQDPSGDTAYSLDKGAILAICLRHRDPKKKASLLDMSTLTFVTLHEITHIALDVIDHPPAFWSTFKWLLLEAEESGIYTSIDYAKHPVRYCGVSVDYNPRYDQKTQIIY
jgi:WLM domain